MRFLKRTDAGEFSLSKEFIGNDVFPPYAILSHTWGKDEDEVTFKDLETGAGRSKAGYRKIQFCGDRAIRDGLQYFWVDTCCIDKSNNTELSEAINSMFSWYQKATKCYVYLSDVSSYQSDKNDHWIPAFRRSRWFTRGWTLQELIAPKSVEFFSREGKRLGDKKSLQQIVCEITGIAISALHGSHLSSFSVKERMAWAEKRQTKRKEDEAYCLLGIFDIHMPLIYGEGMKAFIRLQDEIKKSSMNSILARSPAAFVSFEDTSKTLGRIEQLQPNFYEKCNKCYMSFRSRNALFNHLKETGHDKGNEEEEEEIDYCNRCRMCEEDFESRTALFKHLRMTGHDKSDSGDEENEEEYEEDEDDCFMCYTCGKEFTSQMSLFQHQNATRHY